MTQPRVAAERPQFEDHSHSWFAGIFGLNLYPKAVVHTDAAVILRGRVKTWLFVTAVLIAAGFVISATLAVPQTTLVSRGVASVNDYNAMVAEAGASARVSCTCTQPVTLGSFSRFDYAADQAMNFSANICQPVYALYNVFYSLGADSMAGFCARESPGRVGACSACAAQMAGMRFPGQPNYPTFTTPAGKLWVDSVLPIMYEPCHNVKVAQEAVLPALAAAALPETLLTPADLNASIVGASSPVLANVMSASRISSMLMHLMAAAPAGSPSNISEGSTKAEPRGCDCTGTAAPPCRTFIPAFNDLPRVGNAPNNPAWQCNSINPPWSCNVAASVLCAPFQQLNASSSGLISSTGIPATPDCAAWLMPEPGTLDPAQQYFDAALSRPYMILSGFRPISGDPNAPSLLVFAYDDYFRSCAPTSCSYIRTDTLATNPWLLIMLCVNSLNTEIDLLHLLLGGFVDAVLALGWCTRRGRGRRTPVATAGSGAIDEVGGGDGQAEGVSVGRSKLQRHGSVAFGGGDSKSHVLMARTEALEAAVVVAPAATSPLSGQTLALQPNWARRGDLERSPSELLLRPLLASAVSRSSLQRAQDDDGHAAALALAAGPG